MQDFVDNINASKPMKIEELSDILVLHVMRFSFEVLDLLSLIN